MKVLATFPFVSVCLLAQAQVPIVPPAPAAAVPAPAGQASQAAAPVQALVHATAKAINYRLLDGSTRIEFQGTSLLPDGKGVAKVKVKKGVATVKAKFENLPDPGTFGQACLTYVLWAVSPEGQAANLGELTVKHGKSKIKFTEALPAFGLLVTAEPYFAVTRPSDAVVLENIIGKDTKGRVEQLEAKLDLLPRAEYARDLAQAPATPAPAAGAPVAVLQARQAVRIAQGAGAEKYAAKALAQAKDYLLQSETSAGGEKTVVMTARSATQSAEEARAKTVEGIQAEADTAARKLAQAKLDAAREEAARAAAAAQAQVAAAQAQAAADQAEAQRKARLAEQENAGLRARLMAQLNEVLATRATARGLIVNMSGVLFQTGKATVLPAAREKLAKIAGILATHKGLKLEADGFTDSTGSAAFNARLSEDRAAAVRAVLVDLGVSSDSIVAKGFGPSNPIASNTTEAGRRENRRVELVVAGEGLTGAPS